MGRRGGCKDACEWEGTRGGAIGSGGSRDIVGGKEAGGTRGYEETRGGHYRAGGSAVWRDTCMTGLGRQQHMLGGPGRFGGSRVGSWCSGGFRGLGLMGRWVGSPASPVNPPRSHVSVSWAPAAGRWSRVPPLWEGFLPGRGSPATRGPALLTDAPSPSSAGGSAHAALGGERSCSSPGLLCTRGLVLSSVS